ncbi:radical SAM protein [Streptomyces sp. WI04-05B]|uniref:radical SAM protein n=1 Tax=Streptomyces TaxID=1883 RepID=UPI0029BBA8B6|nr:MULTISPECIES: radical SAM protein [unclassified Streptomyces]MDX2545376.1 radical SAM protein [Streptomyces sp. WI04-05B]MDX2588129.1 radical SAM protein [Streptomyces sp. WI04-05A]
MKALSVHLTDICNSKCNFCIVDSPFVKDDSISRKRVSRFLRENADSGFEAVNIHGGEPTIRRDFLDILKEIKDLGYPTVLLQTNGRKLARRQYAETVMELGVSLFVVSMHGANSLTQDRISKSLGSFRQAVDGITNVKELGAKVRTNSVVCKDNFTEIPEIADLCMDLGADHVNISALHTSGTALRNFAEVTPTYDEIRPYVFEAVDRAVARDRVITLEGFPHCAIPGYEHHMINWRENRFKMLYRAYVFEDYENYMDANARVKDARCGGCAQNDVCGGVYKEYAEFVGWNEFQPFAPADSTATA